jgi:aconitate decarboxylase
VRTVLTFESPGSGACSVFGWGPETKITPLQAALLNSTFIQGFELDDWHSEAPLHSNSLLIPSLLAIAQHEASVSSKGNQPHVTSGKDLLLATIVGYEIGPRVGLALYGPNILSTGWHSGTVFGPPAVAGAVSKLLRLDPAQIEDAMGTACTQACGLMSAQFGSDAKRMQHGFAARNGLMGALLARGGYSGIKNVFEEPYGGFLEQFSKGNGKTPRFLPDEIVKSLGSDWKTKGVNMKPYASMAATHPTVDCVRILQEKYPDTFNGGNLGRIKRITLEMGSDAFHHGGFQATRPTTAVGAQMACMYVAATQLVDRQVLPPQFAKHSLDRDEIWSLVKKTKCVQNDDLGDGKFAQRMTVEFADGKTVTAEIQNAHGVDPELSNEEVVTKWRDLTKDILDADRQKAIEELVLRLETCEDVGALIELLTPVVPSVLA